MESNANLYVEQMLREDLAADEGVEVYHKRLRQARLDKSQDLTTFTPELAMLRQILPTFAQKVRTFIADNSLATRRNAPVKRILKKVDAESLAYITLRHAFNGSYMRSDKNDGRGTATSLQTSCEQLGYQIADQIDFQNLKEKMGKHYMAVLAEDLKSSTQVHKQRVYKRVMVKRVPVTTFEKDEAISVGHHLFNILVECGDYFQLAQWERSREMRYLAPTESMVEWLDKHHELMSVQFPRFRPMIVEPMPWVNPFQGGYLLQTTTNKSRILRSEKSMTLEALVQADMGPVFDAINAIQRTPWTVNKKVLAVAEELIRARQPVAGLPDLRSKSDILAEKAPKSWGPGEEPSEEALKEWKAVSSKVHDEYHRAGSDRVAAIMTVDIARDCAKYDSIWFPHNLDWRGRAYPIPVFLQPQGSDLSKGLLTFAEGVELGSRGMFWLMVHGANSYGVDKVSFEDRVQWVDDHFALIHAVATNPLDDSEAFKFWTEADSPFQFLAFCFEYVGAMKSGNPETFVSHLPVGMDGSCNGPQHLAAMGRDAEAAKLVNLVPTEKPGDIYAEVAKAVSKMVEADLNSDEVMSYEKEDGTVVTTRTAAMAALWHGRVDRKTVKRPTMTVTYGARRYGFREQLKAELGNQEGLGYLVRRIDEALRVVVKQGFEVMEYLQDVAHTICETDGKPLAWRSPLGLPVVQEKLGDGGVKRIETFWGGTRVRMTLRKESKKIHTVKMVNGISPNFVHSLDSTHMFMVVNRLAQREGLTSFACVHDSFGTHAGNIDRMNVAIREEFVKLYSVDRLKEWRDMVLEGASSEAKAEVLAIPMPEKGTLDLNKVLESRYFFA